MATEAQPSTITELTRHNLFEDLAAVDWSGRLSEVDFLSRVFDLASLPSHDPRAPNIAGDIELHRVQFPGDWPNDWIFTDDRFNLMHCADGVLLRLLCEMVHPMVRREPAKVEALVALFNRHLAPDGYQVRPTTLLSGRPIFSAIQPQVVDHGPFAGPQASGTFSQRHGYEPPAPPITIRDDAPEFLRHQLATIMWQAGIKADEARDIVCRCLRQVPDGNNWSEGNIAWEVEGRIQACDWFKVYDIIEAVDAHLRRAKTTTAATEGAALTSATDAAAVFERSTNALFIELGIGWQLVDGRITTRGEVAFERSVSSAIAALDAANQKTSRSELQEALIDLSRRPKADVSGAVQHGMAALECLAREVAGDRKATLGELLKRYSSQLDIPKPLDSALEKAWGYASERGRHIKEGQEPKREEAELIIGICAALITYLSGRKIVDEIPF